MIINPALNPFYNPDSFINSSDPYRPGNPYNIAWFAFYEAANQWQSKSQGTINRALGILFRDLATDYWLLLSSLSCLTLENNIRVVQTETFCRVRRYIENFYKLKNLLNDPEFMRVINAKENNKERDEKFPDKYEKHKDLNGFITLRGLGECLRANDEGIIKDFDSDVLFEVECINGKCGESLYSINQKGYTSVDGKSIPHPIDILSGIAKTANPYVHGKIWTEVVEPNKLCDQLQGIFYMCLECLHIALKKMMEKSPLVYYNNPAYYWHNYKESCYYDRDVFLKYLYESQREIIKNNPIL